MLHRYPQEKALRYVNEVLFEMVEKSLKDKYIEGTNPKELKNKVSKFQEIFYDKETRVMVNKLVNYFYTRLLFKVNSPPHDTVLPL